MEEYQGVSMLATNLRQNLDEAFVRRLQAIIEFPFPNEEYRRKIWEGVFPAEAPLAEDVKFDLLAREVRLAGGNIKNMAVAAAFYAATDGDKIRMKHLVQAAHREHQKLARAWNESELLKAQMVTA
jgi:ATP-dependent 26S proteasome regulatory subunit